MSARISYGQSNLTSQVKVITPILFGTYSIAAVTDVSLTQYGLGKGSVREANPFQRYFTDKGPLTSGIAKGSMHFAIGYFLYRKKDTNRKAVIISLITLSMAQIAVDYSNYKQINKH